MTITTDRLTRRLLTIAVTAALAITGLLAGSLPGTASAAPDDSDGFPSCSQEARRLGLVARDDIVRVRRGSEASVDPLLNDAFIEESAAGPHLVQPRPPVGVTIAQDSAATALWVSVAANYDGPRYFDLRYNLAAGSGAACDRGGLTVPVTRQAVVTIRVAGYRPEPRRIATVSLAPGERHRVPTRTLVPRGDQIWQHTERARRGVRLVCGPGERCFVVASRSATGGPRLFRIQSVSLEDGSRTTAFVIARVSRR